MERSKDWKKEWERRTDCNPATDEPGEDRCVAAEDSLYYKRTFHPKYPNEIEWQDSGYHLYEDYIAEFIDEIIVDYENRVTKAYKDGLSDGIAEGGRNKSKEIEKGKSEERERTLAMVVQDINEIGANSDSYDVFENRILELKDKYLTSAEGGDANSTH